jgi:hypothetical protein
MALHRLLHKRSKASFVLDENRPAATSWHHSNLDVGHFVQVCRGNGNVYPMRAVFRNYRPSSYHFVRTIKENGAQVSSLEEGSGELEVRARPSNELLEDLERPIPYEVTLQTDGVRVDIDLAVVKDKWSLDFPTTISGSVLLESDEDGVICPCCLKPFHT